LKRSQVPHVTDLEEAVPFESARAGAALCVLCLAALLVTAPVLFAAGIAPAGWMARAAAVAAALAAVAGVGKSVAVVVGLVARFTANPELGAAAAGPD
jgi:hypothetical protein